MVVVGDVVVEGAKIVVVVVVVVVVGADVVVVVVGVAVVSAEVVVVVVVVGAGVVVLVDGVVSVNVGKLRSPLQFRVRTAVESSTIVMIRDFFGFSFFLTHPSSIILIVLLFN